MRGEVSSLHHSTGCAYSPKGVYLSQGGNLGGAGSPVLPRAPLQHSSSSALVPLHVAPTHSHISVAWPSALCPLPMVPALSVGSCHGLAAIGPLQVPVWKKKSGMSVPSIAGRHTAQSLLCCPLPGTPASLSKNVQMCLKESGLDSFSRV